MDLKFSKPKWVGSIYHTFEAICHEVDDFVSQETVKFVENQAQTVGDSVKKLYSNVVQDLLPTSSAQHGKHEAPILSLEQNYKGIEENKVQFVVKDENSDLSLGSEIKNLERDDMCDASFEENDHTEGPIGKIPSSFEENERTITNANSVKTNYLKIEPFLPKEKEGQINAKANNLGEIDSKREPSEPKGMDLFSPDNKDLSEASFSNNIPEIDATCDVISGLEMKFGVVSSDNMRVESGLVSSNSPLSSELVDVLHNEKNTSYYLVDEIGNASDPVDSISSSLPLPTASCNDTDMKLALSSSAFDEDIPSADDIAALVTSFEDNQCNDYSHLEALMSFLKVGKEDTEKLDGNSDFAENKLLYGVLHRSWKNKSYKKILQDAFASRKRLKKEYEQLGILFGDIIETSKQREHNILPEIPSSSLGSGKLPLSDLSEWEIL